MSKEQKIGESSEKQAKDIVQSQPQHHSSQQASPQHPASEPSTKPKQPPNESQSSTSDTEPKKPAAVPGMPDQTSDKTSPTTPEDPRSRPRQVIAVSASKGPAAFFNLARKFLVTDETCDLSALEGAIVSAADAAHLLERSKLATIVRVQTSYVAVEPKRKKQDSLPSSPVASLQSSSPDGSPPAPPAQLPSEASTPRSGRPSPSIGEQNPQRELRRARIVITVKRTENYRQWLEENPLQAVIVGDVDEEHDVEDIEVHHHPVQER